MLAAVAIAAVVGLFSNPIFGALSDRIGRRPVYLAGAVLSLVYSFLFFPLMGRGAAFVPIAIILGLNVTQDMMYGPQAALIAESFTGRLRYSGASLGYQLASVFAGGPAPLIAAWLFGTYHSGMAISLYILGCAVISLAATAMLKDYTNKDISLV